MTVLPLALILGSISVASAASGKVKLTDIADNTNEEAIQVTYDLGIVTGTPEGGYEPEKAVNRAEFAALITRALSIPESALSYYSTTTFKDTSGYGWAVPYLAVLQQRGIMKGDGYGNAMPGRTITPNEAVTMVLRAVGYTDNASVLVGQWPANYVSLGQSQNLYAKVANDLQMNKASAAQMIYNVLLTQLVQVDANSTVKYLYDADTNIEQNLLTTSLNCKRDPELGGKKIVNYGDAAVSKINLLPNVGAYGVLYRSKADDEVVALTNVETEFIAGRFVYNTNTNLVNNFVGVDGKSYNLSSGAQDWANALAVAGGSVGKPTTNSAIFLNGVERTALTNTERDDYIYYNEPASGLANDNQSAKLIIAARVSGVTILDLRTIAVWDATPPAVTGVYGDHFLYEAGMYTSGDKKFNGHDLPVDVNNEVDHYGYILVGEGIESLDDIKADNVVYVYKNNDKKIARIDVGTATQSGTITNVNLADHARTIGGTVLYTTPLGWSGKHAADLNKAGNEGTALLDIYHRLYDFQLGDAFKGNFAVLLASNNSFQSTEVKLFDKTGTEVVYGFTGDFKLTIGSVVSNDTAGAKTASNYINTDLVSASPTLKGALVEYVLSGGKLSEIRVGVPSTPAPTAGPPAVPASNWSVNKAGSIVTIGGTDHLLESNALVYVHDAVTGRYSVGSVKDLVDKNIESPFWYIIGTTDTRAKALIVNDSDAGAQKVFVMINSIPAGYDNGAIDIVNGIGFAEGVKSWPYAGPGLHSSSALGLDAPGLTETQQRGRYSMMVQFSIDETGVLKNAVRLDDQNDTDNVDTAAGFYHARRNVALAAEPYDSGSIDSSFNLILSGAAVNFVTCASDTVLYKVVDGIWTAVKVSNASTFRDDDTTPDLYTFLKTDPKGTYNVIIKTQ
jgi:hypothetical protein